jgi:hypothetical protein
MGIVETIALSMGVAWASGINLYAAICMLGVLSTTGNIELPETLLILEDPMVIFASGFMYVVEFFADKVPGVDTGWDTIHTFIRIPAGAVLAAGAVGELGAGAELAAAIAGGTLAAGTHATKAGTRALINASPEPLTNWTASVAEDVIVIGGVWAMLHHPAAFLVFLPRIWRGVKSVIAWLRNKLGGGTDDGGTPSIKEGSAS